LNALPQDPRLGSLAGFLRDLRAFVGWRRGSRLLALLWGATLLEGIGLLLLLPLIGLVLGSGTGIEWLDQMLSDLIGASAGQDRVGQLALLLGLFTALVAARSWFVLKRDLALARLQSGYLEGHRLRIIAALARTRWETVARLSHGRITHVLGAEIQSLGDAAHLTLLVLVNCTLLAVQMLLVLLLSPSLALVILLLLGLAVLALRPMIGRARRLGLSLTELSLDLVTGTGHFLGGLKLAISQNLQQSFVDRFRATVAATEENRLRFARQRSVSQIALTAIPALIAGAVVLVGIGFLDTPAPVIITFLLVLGRMAGPVTAIQAGVQHIYHCLPAHSVIVGLERELAASAEPQARVRQERLERALPLVIDQVSYRHGSGEAGVHALSLSVEPGEFLAITGPSGGGKTTLADIMVGLYPPQSGRVLVGGKPLAGGLIEAWRGSLSYVSQDPFLFHDSIRNNLLWARANATEAELWDVIETAGAGELVRRIGLDIAVGERGGLLSGGERQRIALARALLRRPVFLLLDEATNAIDMESETAILGRLAATPERPSIVMIAHRESSVALCDRRVELRDGRIVDG